MSALSEAAKAVNAIRSLSIDMIEQANSGHPGLPLGAAPMAYVLFAKHLRFDPQAPDWADRDRFILSAGHGSALLYSLLHLFGYSLSIDDLKGFRQLGSRTPGHPEFGVTPGVEATTGPLGQGSAVSVGLAIAEAMLGGKFNRENEKLIDHFTYALVSDGDLMEGISAEAASLAGHLKLGKLIYLYDSNDICLDGPTSITFTENVEARYRAYGWHTVVVENGDDDLDAIDKAITEAKAETDRPSLIIVRTTIGYGSPNQGECSCHGAPLGDEGVEQTKSTLGCESTGEFGVADSIREHFKQMTAERAAAHTEWKALYEKYSAANPDAAAELESFLAGKLPENLYEGLPQFEDGQKIASRKAGGMILNALADRIGYLSGGDADLSSSTQTRLKSFPSFSPENRAGRNIHFGVREHSMAAIVNGLAYHGGVRPYCSTFFSFANYMIPSMRLAAMDNLSTLYIFTHDSIGVGEDGPTHQPVEHLAQLRAMPGMKVFRPADARETAAAWVTAISTEGPSTLVLTRQNLPTLAATADKSAEGVARGAYIIYEPDSDPQAIIIATGSEVASALEASAALQKDGIAVRVVSAPCLDLFEAQEKTYRDSVLPPQLKARVSVEAAASQGWHRWTGDGGLVIGLDRFGASAPAGQLMEKFGFTPDKIAEAVKETIG